MKYSYLRVSSRDQNIDRQLDAVKAYAPDLLDENIFIDKQSGKDFERAEYQRMKALLEPGDEVIVKELDRLGRNKNAVKDEIQWYRKNKITLRILNLPTSLIDYDGQEWIIDMLNNILIEVLAAVAEEERAKIRSRQAEGIALAKAKGIAFGRTPIKTPKYAKYAEKVERGEMTIVQACDALKISRATWYNIKDDPKRSGVSR